MKTVIFKANAVLLCEEINYAESMTSLTSNLPCNAYLNVQRSDQDEA